jgi:hypothetical protein
MGNTKAVGVAYSDPEFESVTVSGAVTAGSVSGATVATTTASGLQFTFGNGQGFYALTTAITANSTTTSAVAGSIGITTNATGVGKLFMADGTKWQFAVVA